ncbi:hypothetical protein Dimus_005563, partial [Dionaea muscipula]
ESRRNRHESESVPPISLVSGRRDSIQWLQGSRSTPSAFFFSFTPPSRRSSINPNIPFILFFLVNSISVQIQLSTSSVHGLGFRLPLPARVASPSWVRPRDSFLESWEEKIRAPPAVCARKKESAVLSSRILMKKLDLAMAERDSGFEKLGSRRFTRLSSTVHLPSSSQCGVQGPELSPVVESECLEGELTVVTGDATSFLGDAPGSSPVFEMEGGQVGVSVSSIDQALGRSSMEFSASVGAAMQVGSTQVSLDFSPLVAETLEVVQPAMADLVVAESLQVGGDLGQAVPRQIVGQAVLRQIDGQFVLRQNVGMVVDSPMEGGQQDPSAVGVALRLPSTDGRQQRPLQSADSSCPVAGAGHGGRGGPEVSPMGCGKRDLPCIGDHHGSEWDRVSVGGLASEGMGRSYASAVRPDRQSDVRLHFVPSVIPADGVEVCMLDSDRDELEWGVCLVGHFL